MEKNVNAPPGYSEDRTGEATVACWTSQPDSGGWLTVMETAMGDVVHSQASNTLRESMSGTRRATVETSTVNVEGEPAHSSTSISFSSSQISMRRRIIRILRDRTVTTNLSLTIFRILSCIFLGVRAVGSLSLMRLEGLEEGRHEM